MIKHPRILFFTVAFLSMVSFSFGQTTWDGSEPNDLWFTADNWDTGVAPNGAGDQAIVGAPSPTVTDGDVLLQSLNVTADGILNVGASRNLNFAPGAVITITNAGAITALNNSDFQVLGMVDNTGSITIASAGNQTDMEIGVGGATLDGGGTVTLTGPLAGINDASGTQTLTIANQTIQGVGHIGRNSADFDNQSASLIEANVGAGVLVLDSSSLFVNAGTLRATGGGILQMQDPGVGGYLNTGGTIEALASSEVRLTSGARIIGGVISTSGDGIITSIGSSDVEFDNLTLNGNYTSGNNSDTRITGTINNTGTITIASSGNQTDLEVNIGGATLTGGGTVTLTGPLAGINDAAGSQTLTIADQTIQGNGDIGRNTLDVDNQAGNLIHANVNSNVLLLDAVNLFKNAGIVRASGGGIIEIRGAGIGDFLNTGGTIEALAGSEVRLTANARIIGGVISTSGDGIITSTVSSDVEFENLTLNGNFASGNNSDTRISGTINNTGTMTIASTGNQTDLEVGVGGATLTGGGTVTLTGPLAGINDASGTQTLTITDQTIQGTGDIGRNTTNVDNQTGNLIHANVSSSILLLDADTLFKNAGVVRASGGGIIEIHDAGSGDFLNTGGTIEALAGSEVRLTANARIIGGVISTIGDGIITSTVSSDVEFDNLTLNGNFTSGNNSDTRIAGTINNTGTITIASTGNQTDLEVGLGGALLTGGGTVTLTGPLAGINDVSGTQTLLIDDQTIQGNGDIGRNTTNIINSAAGTILANVMASALTIDEAGSVPFTNGGTLAVANGANLRVVGDITSLNTSALSGNGTITATGGMIDHAGSISPGESPGELVLEGSVALQSTADLFIEIGGTTQGVDFDLLDITGTLALDGELDLSLIGSFEPLATDTFEIVKTTGLSGAFSNVSNGGILLTDDGLGQFTVNYGIGSLFNESSVVLSDYVNLTVPEPSALLLTLLASLSLARRRH